MWSPRSPQPPVSCSARRQWPGGSGRQVQRTQRHRGPAGTSGRTGRIAGRPVCIDAFCTSGTIAQDIRDAATDYLLAVKADQPTLCAEIEACFAVPPSGTIPTPTEHDEGHGRIAQRDVAAIRAIGWLCGEWRFPGAPGLPDAACLIRVQARLPRGRAWQAATPRHAPVSPPPR